MASDEERRDLVSIIREVEAALNAHDVGRAVSFFDEGATVKVLPPLPGEAGVYTGKGEFGDFLRRHIAGFQMTSHDFRTVAENEVTWMAEVSGDTFRQFDLDPVETTNEAVFQDGKITSFALVFSDESAARLQTGAPTA
jgi:hypothetical protein